MKQLLSFYCVCMITLTACKSGGTKKTSDKYADVFAKYQPRITELRNFLSGLPSSLKETGIAVFPGGNLNPVVNLGNYDTTGNTLVLQYHLLAAPENFSSYDSLFGLYYNTLAADAFKWTGSTKERMIFERDYLKDEDVDKIIAPLSANRFPYLLIVKIVSMQPLKLKADGTYEGGGATANYYLYDWRNKKELSSISLSANPDDEMMYAFQSKNQAAGKNEAAIMKAKETMQKNMRAKVYAWLKDITSGTALLPAASN